MLSFSKKKVHAIPARLGVRAFQSCHGGCHYLWDENLSKNLSDLRDTNKCMIQHIDIFDLPGTSLGRVIFGGLLCVITYFQIV